MTKKELNDLRKARDRIQGMILDLQRDLLVIDDRIFEEVESQRLKQWEKDYGHLPSR